MPSTEERLTAIENSIIRMATNKEDIVDAQAARSAINTQLADHLTSIQNLIARVDSIQERVINQI